MRNPQPPTAHDGGKRRNGRKTTAGLVYVAKYRRGHVQVFEGRRLRYLVTGYFSPARGGEMAHQVETLYGPLATGRDYLRILRNADRAHACAEAQALQVAA